MLDAMAKLTRWGHSCVRLEVGGRVLVLDPGTYSDVGDALAGAQEVLVTHEHPDHLDVEAVVSAARRGVDVGGPEPVVAALAAAGAPGERLQVLRPGDHFRVAGFDVQVLGGEHAVIHPDLPPVANLAYLVDGAVLHPGDSWALPPAGTAVDVLLLPLGAPWLRVSDAVEHVRAVRPRRVVGIHDAGLADFGRGLAAGLVGRLGGAGDVLLPEPGVPIAVPSLGRDVPAVTGDTVVPPRPEEAVADVARSRPDPAGHGGAPA